MEINPFRDTIVSEPRRIERPVKRLNDAPLKRLIESFGILEQGRCPRAQSVSKVPFVLSPQPGYGKSHLIGRLFKHLHGRATLVYLRPFESPNSCWKSILLKTIQEMEFPDSAEAEYCLSEEPNQLEALVHGILMNVVVNGLQDGQVQTENKEQMLRVFRGVTLKKLRGNRRWISWVEKKKPLLSYLMGEQLGQIGVKLNSSPESWLNVLVKYAYFPKQSESRRTCLEWMKGCSVDDDEAKEIDIRLADRPGYDWSVDVVNETCKNRIMDYLGIAGFYRPFVFCFDQTEKYRNEEMSSCFAEVIRSLADEGCNHLTVITANQELWDNRIKPYWEPAQIARLLEPYLELEAITKDQAHELISHRIEGWDQSDQRTRRFLDGKWLAETFQKAPRMGVRQFLDLCSAGWDPMPLIGLKEYYSGYVQKLRAKPKRLVYDPDALHWLIHELAGPKITKVKEFKSEKGYLSVVWELADRKIYFGFEAGCHFKRWQGIKRETHRYFEADSQRSKSVFLRTPELRFIPGAHWKIAPEIDEARADYLHIMILSRSDIAEVYAAYDLYLDAGEGDIPFASDKVLTFLREELKPLWERIVNPSAKTWSNVEPALPTTIVEPKVSLIKQIREIVQREKFLSEQDLIAKISPPVSEEELSKARACIAEIQVHTSPNMTVFQWRPSG